MNQFYFSRTYTFKSATGKRKRYFFNLIDSTSNEVTFCVKGNTDTVSAKIVKDNDTDTATFLYKDCKCTLRADEYIPKRYPVLLKGMLERKEDWMRDAHMHTSYNRSEIEHSKSCCCISCQTFFNPTEVDYYIDNGQTGMCPYCGIDALIADASGMKITDSMLIDLYMHYFHVACKPQIELIIDKADESNPTPCSPYVWIVSIQNCKSYAIDTNYYTSEEAPYRLSDFLKKVPIILSRATFEAVDCKLYDIKGKEATKAIYVAIAKYFEREDENTKTDLSQFKIRREVDFTITTVWDGKTTYFTLLSDNSLRFPPPIRNLLSGPD